MGEASSLALHFQLRKGTLQRNVCGEAGEHREAGVENTKKQETGKQEHNRTELNFHSNFHSCSDIHRDVYAFGRVCASTRTRAHTNTHIIEEVSTCKCSMSVNELTGFFQRADCLRVLIG